MLCSGLCRRAAVVGGNFVPFNEDAVNECLGQGFVRISPFLSQLGRGWNGCGGTKTPGAPFQDISGLGGKMGMNSTLLGVFVPRKSIQGRGQGGRGAAAGTEDPPRLHFGAE